MVAIQKQLYLGDNTEQEKQILKTQNRELMEKDWKSRGRKL